MKRINNIIGRFRRILSEYIRNKSRKDDKRKELPTLSSGLEQEVSSVEGRKYGDIVLGGARYYIGQGKRGILNSGKGRILELLLTYAGVEFDANQLVNIAEFGEYYPKHAPIDALASEVNHHSQYVDILKRVAKDSAGKHYLYKAVIHEQQKDKTTLIK